MYSEDEEDYGLEYSEDSASEPDIDLENQYYHSKSIKNEDPRAAISAFQKVLDFQGSARGVWGFKALKQMVKINFYLRNYHETMETYKELLTYVKQSVTKNYAEKTINSILDYTSSLKDMTILQSFYEATLEALRYAKNDRLWFKTQTKLGKVYLERGDFAKLAHVVKQLNNACTTEEGEDDLSKSNQLLEIYALQIQMFTALQNSKLLKKVYERSLRMRSAVSHPLIMGIIRECGGKMHLREADYERAYTDFFEAFMNYDEAGNPRRTTCLKYLILTSMLMKSSINPFDSQEAKPYKNDPEINSLTNLINAYQSADLKQFEIIFKENRESLMEDAFIQEHVEDLLKNVRTQVLLQCIKPYRVVKLTFLSDELNITLDETENLVVSCILDGKIAGRIDQINQVLVNNSVSNTAKEVRFHAVDKLATNIDSISQTFSFRLGL